MKHDMAQDCAKRKNIHEGVEVDIVLKKDQQTGKLTRGVVKDVLTSKSYHPRGIKVRLWGGMVGRVKKIYDNDDESYDRGYLV